MESKFVENKLRAGDWRPEVVPASIVGLGRDVTIFRATRKTNLVTYGVHGDMLRRLSWGVIGRHLLRLRICRIYCR